MLNNCIARKTKLINVKLFRDWSYVVVKNHVFKKKIKLLFVSRDPFPPFRVDVRILFGQEITDRGHSIDWILQSGTICDTSYQAIWSGCRVLIGPTDLGKSSLNKLRKHIYSIKHDFRMFALARKNKYDFIQVRDKFLSAILAIIASKVNKTKFLYWLSFPFPEASLYAARKGITNYPLFFFIRGTVFKLLLYKIILPKAHHIFVQSEQMKKNISLLGIPKEKMTVVPMGVSLKSIPYDPYRKESQKKNILYLGSLNKNRRIDFLIRAFYKVQLQFASVEFYIVGGSDNPIDEQMLKDEAETIGIGNNIVFTGFIPMQKAWHLVNKASVCVSFINPIPILNVGSPTKIIEYMAMGKPVVANDHPEQLSIISESQAGFCVPSQEDAFADAIIALLNYPEKAIEMGSKGRKYVERFRSYTKIADIVEREYLRL